MSGWGDSVRRPAELVLGAAALVVVSPVLAVSALVVRVTSGPGVLHRQRRLGRGGRHFELLKLRTMRHADPGREGPEHDSERITAVGAWLRSTSIDELPSLLNVVRGDIGLVGPRPLPVHYWERFRGREYERFLVRPGLTGLAQVNGRNELGWPERLRADVEYVRSRSVRGDVGIVIRTVPLVVRRHGISEPGGVTMTALPADRPIDDAGYV